MLPYGCHNRADYKQTLEIQDGWEQVPGTRFRIPIMKEVPFRMRQDCSYGNETELGRNDPRCFSCNRRKPDAKQA